MPFYNLKELTDALISPDHSTAHGPTITGEQLEVGYYSEPKGTGAKAHHHKSEQIMLVLEGRMRMRIADQTREISAGEVAVIPGDVDHEQVALEDNTKFISFKTADGAQPEGE